MSNLALVFDEKHLPQLKCALALSIADHNHDLFHAVANAKPVAEPESCEMQEKHADEDDDNDRRFLYGDIVGPRSCRHRAALDRDELYIVVTDECRAVGSTQVEVVPFSFCTSAASANAKKLKVDVAYLTLKIAAEDRELFTVNESTAPSGETVYNVLTPNGNVAASFHSYPGLDSVMAEEFAYNFCRERRDACLLEDNEDYELIFPTEEELKQLEYDHAHE